MAGFDVIINSVDQSAIYMPGTLQVQKSLGGRNTAGFRLFSSDSSYEPEVGHPVEIEFDDNKIFGGTIDRKRVVHPGASSDMNRFIEVECVGWQQIASRRLMVKEYAKQAAGTIVNSVFTEFLADEGVTAGDIDIGVSIGPLSVNYQSVARFLDRVSSSTGYAWWIDDDKQLHFRARTSVVAPYSLNSANLDKYESLVCDTSRSKLRNFQVVRGGFDAGTQRTESFDGDDDRTNFNLTQPVAETPTVSLSSGGDQTVGIRGVDDEDDASGFEWFWSKGENSISQNTTDAPISSSNVITVVYKPLTRIVDVEIDAASITDRAAIEGGTGRYEIATDEGQVNDAQTVKDIAAALIDQFSTIPCKARILSHASVAWQLEPGQLQTIDLSQDSLDDDFLITDVSFRDLGSANHLVTSYSATSGRFDGGWEELWKRIAVSSSDFVRDEPSTLYKIFESIENVHVVVTDSTASGDNRVTIAQDDHQFAKIGDPNSKIGSEYDSGDPAVPNVSQGPVVGTFIA